MAGTAWSKFFWSDWANDPTLRLCSLSAQGFWMRLLCIAAEADPIGYVVCGGRQLDGQDLARLTGVSVPEAESLLQELDRNGVFSRDGKGRIYSRRLVRDAKRAAQARKNGKTGGNPSLRKQTGITASDNPPVKAQDNTHKPYARSQEPGRKNPEAKKLPAGKPPNGNAPKSMTLEAEVYRRGKEILGASAGGLITRLRSHYDGDWLAVKDVLEQAAAKGEPREWVGGVLRGSERPRTPEHILHPPEIYRNLQ